MNAQERMTAIRNEVLEAMGDVIADATQIGVAEFAVETANGFARVKVTATKPDFDVAEAQETFIEMEAEKAEKARVRKEKAEAKKAADLAKKAAKEKAKTEKE